MTCTKGLLVLTLISACLMSSSNCLTPRVPYRFHPLNTDLRRTFGQENYLQTKNHCFKWTSFHFENGTCSELKVSIAFGCRMQPYETFYVPCDLNINVNSYIGTVRLRVWDFLYTDDWPELYFMKRDGSCEKRSYRNHGGMKVALGKEQCDIVKAKVFEESVGITEYILKRTWYEPDDSTSNQETETVTDPQTELRFRGPHDYSSE